jgi:hypothetical protein
MENWYLRNNIVSDKQDALEQGIASFEEMLEESLESVDVSFEDSNGVVEDYTVIMLDDSPESVNTTVTRKMLTRLTDDSVGKIIYYNNEKWLPINYIIKDNTIYNTTKIQTCQVDLKWIDAWGEEQTTPCVTKMLEIDTLQTEDFGTFKISNEDQSILIQNNNNTKYIKVGHRFIIGDSPYKVNAIYDYLFPKLFFMSVEQDEIRVNDDLELKIAENIYTEVELKLSETDNTLAFSDNTDNGVMYYGIEFNIEGILFDIDGTPVIPQPTMVYDISDNSLVSISQNLNKLIITPIDNKDNTTKKLTITANTVDNLYTVEKEFKIARL